jgi:adenylate cyclase
MDWNAEGMLDDCADEPRLAVASDGEDLPALRAGIAFGPAVNRWGDWYGSSVNVASRLTARARPRLRAGARGGRERYDWSYAGEKRLKGLSASLKTCRALALTATSDG